MSAPLRVVSVVGARPNFVKLAPVSLALSRRPNVDHVVVHTGQHYDDLLSAAFFEQLGIAPPGFNLGVGSGTHAQQTAAVLERVEPICQQLAPDWVLVYGDVNSTVAAALAAVKLGLPVAHVEAGLRSDDRTMPEEHNRVVTDHLADLLLAPSRDAVERLCHEGIPEGRIAFVGNVMIDTLVRLLPRARALDMPERLGVEQEEFVLVTLHRPANVDDPQVFDQICGALAEIARTRPVIFPLHPRSRARVDAAGLRDRLHGVRLLDPLPYLEMLGVMERAGIVITDSGGVQEETAFLGIPCVTVRSTTERPVTIMAGTNRLVAAERQALVSAAMNGHRRIPPPVIERWDGGAGERIAQVLCDGARF